MCAKSKQFWSVTDPNLSQSPDQVTVSKEKGVGSIPCVQGMGQPLVASSCNLLWLIMVINNQHGNLLSDNLVCYSFDICILLTGNWITSHGPSVWFSPQKYGDFQFATLRLLRMTIHSMAPWGFEKMTGKHSQWKEPGGGVPGLTLEMGHDQPPSPRF